MKEFLEQSLCESLADFVKETLDKLLEKILEKFVIELLDEFLEEPWSKFNKKQKKTMEIFLKKFFCSVWKIFRKNP